MTLKDLAEMFNNALKGSFGLKKNFFVFIALVLSGLIYLFFQALSFEAASWLQLPLHYVPLFFVIGLVMASGTFLIQVYAREKQGESLDFLKMAKESWEQLLKASYLAVPLLILFLIFWVLLGLFLLLRVVPIFAFAPFILNLATLCLFFVALLSFFFVTPDFAMSGKFDQKAIFKRLRADFFTNALLLVVACFPVWIVWKFVQKAAVMTAAHYFADAGGIETIIQSVFMMIPFVAVLTPAVTFFFNFAYESIES